MEAAGCGLPVAGDAGRAQLELHCGPPGVLQGHLIFPGLEVLDAVGDPLGRHPGAGGTVLGRVLWGEGRDSDRKREGLGGEGSRQEGGGARRGINYTDDVSVIWKPPSSLVPPVHNAPRRAPQLSTVRFLLLLAAVQTSVQPGSA